MASSIRVKDLLETITEFKNKNNGRNVCFICGRTRYYHSIFFDDQLHAFVDAHEHTLKLLEEKLENVRKQNRESARRYRAAHKQRWNEYNRKKQAEWRQNHPERSKAISSKSRSRVTAQEKLSVARKKYYEANRESLQAKRRQRYLESTLEKRTKIAELKRKIESLTALRSKLIHTKVKPSESLEKLKRKFELSEHIEELRAELKLWRGKR